MDSEILQHPDIDIEHGEGTADGGFIWIWFPARRSITPTRHQPLLLEIRDGNWPIFECRGPLLPQAPVQK